MTLLYQPYPFYYTARNLHKIAAVCFGATFLFLWLFKPFIVNVQEQKLSYEAICFIHALSPSIIFYFYVLLLQAFLTDDAKDKWTVSKEVLMLSFAFLLFGIGSFLVRDIIYTNPDNWSWRYFIEEIENSFLAGTLLSVLLVLINFYRMSGGHSQSARTITIQHPVNTDVQSFEELSISTQVKADDFTLRVDDFLFAKSNGNYLELYHKTHSNTQKLLKRMTMAQLEEQVNSIPHLFRCHRAYLINTQQIVDISGNAQGYLLKFENMSEKIPVSRNRLADFNRLDQQKLIGKA